MYNQIILYTFKIDNKFPLEINKYKILKLYHDLDNLSGIIYILNVMETSCKTVPNKKLTS